MRVHRASGHSSFANLQKLLRVRKAPAWAIELAGSLECPVCKEAKQARSVPVASLKELPGLFEILGMDVFEYEHTSKQKYKFLLMRDRASGLVSVEFLKEYGGDDQPRSWEPSTNDIVTCVCKWLMWNPTPKWILTDSATYFTSAAFLDFCGQSGMGLLTTPAEAHEMLGAEESCIRVMKEAARRLLLEEPDLAMGDAFRLAAHGHNQSVGPSGFSPFQWTRGSSSPVENLPLGLDPSKAFDGMLKLKETADEPHRQLQERWRGESRFEIKEEESLDARKSRRVPKKGQKRKNVEEVEQEEQQPGQPSSSSRAAPLTPSGIDGTVLPEVPEMQPLTTALRERGASTVDGVPATPLSDGNEGEGNHCRVPQCTLPGGHDGPHKDAGGQGFSWEPYGGRVNVEASEEEDESSDSTSSSSSEELRPDVPDVPRPAVRKRKKEQTDDSLFVFEISVEPEDTKFLMNHPRKAAIWLSKKMESKGKEKLWSKMNLEEKYKFDEAQAKELSNVLTARALRSLTSQEELNLNRRQIMQMRWVMTVKNDKSAKARLVVLGYQAPNLTQVMASSPTMSRLGRYVLLTLCANYKFKLKSGDVTSAFLQASQSLEEENLFVWAPPELAVLYGASPQNPSKVLKVCKAFYGLVHAPRKWYEHVCMTLVSQGWTKLRSDGCIFVLLHEGTIRGLAGLHVDDFLIGGKEDDPVFKAAEQALMDSYRWGKWEEKQFEFAGTTITQHSDFSISVNQDDYLTKWLSEVELPKERWLERKALLTNEETSALRGLVGTMSWKASQTGPHYAADVGLLLSSVPTATIDTLIWANKMAREMKRDSQQSICFPSWGIPWEDLAVVTWADASQKNRPDRSSTLGLFTGVGPKEILFGEEASIAIVNWRSAKTPRQCLGSNGAEVQAITEGEDVTFKVRAMLLEFHGIDFTRKTIYEKVRQHTKGALVMDSRGVFDAATRNMSALHGLRSSRAGYELTLAVGQARSVDTEFRWVNGLAQLADALTKSNSRKILLQLFGNGQRWRLIFDPKFLAGKKVRKKELLEAIRKQQEVFICSIRDLALANRWPWDDPEVRSMGDEISQHDSVPFALDDMWLQESPLFPQALGWESARAKRGLALAHELRLSGCWRPLRTFEKILIVVPW